MVERDAVSDSEGSSGEPLIHGKRVGALLTQVVEEIDRLIEGGTETIDAVDIGGGADKAVVPEEGGDEVEVVGEAAPGEQGEEENNEGGSEKVGEDLLPCTIIADHVKLVLQWRGMLIPNYRYEFYILDESRDVNKVTHRRRRVCFFEHMFKRGFHLPLHPFFETCLEGYDVAASQLEGSFWCIMVAYFLDCKLCGEALLFASLHNLYRLNVMKGGRTGYFTARGKKVVEKFPSNCHIVKTNYFEVELKLEDKWPFKVEWSMPNRAKRQSLYEPNDLEQKQFNYYQSHTIDWEKVGTHANIYKYYLENRNFNHVASHFAYLDVGEDVEGWNTSEDPI